MLTRLDLRGKSGRQLVQGLPRPGLDGEGDGPERPDGAGHAGPLEAVRAVLAEVRSGGDAAVREFTARFDGVRSDDFRVAPAQVAAALDATPAPLREALEAAAAAITAYHQHQLPSDARHERDGVVVRDLCRPVDRAGLYAPGGRARYPSTVLMTAIPARVAGVPELVLCVPPEPGGGIAEPTLAAAALAGVDEVYAIGGAQAVAAMAYGTETIRPVDVIVGPGNVYVALAKREVAGEGLVGVPSGFAGPSEVVVVADDTTPVEWAAIDLVVQAEHGPDGLAWLLTWSEPVADAVTASVERLVVASPRRIDLEKTLGSGGYAVLVDGPEQAIAVTNAIAPEHLELMSADPEALLPLVRHAGAVFLGLHAPASVGDYLAGPSHVLPTFGSARFSSGLRVDDFLRHMHAVSLDEAALARVAPHVAALAEAEGLLAHADSVRVRSGAAATNPMQVAP